MAFKVGQKVVCIRENWETVAGPHKGRSGFGPKKHDIVEISGLHNYKGDVYLIFIEYGDKDAFTPKNFRPLDYDFVEEVIKQVKPQEVEV